MSDKNLARALHAADEYEVRNAPPRHAQRTDACPSVDRLTREYYTRLSDEIGRAHV